jgi:ATP-dependent DNA helicase RecQ
VESPSPSPSMTSDLLRSKAEEVLRRYWKYDGFRAGQFDAIGPVLEGRDVLAILPTGGGKSICYQVPALVREGLTLVVSPLIALMQDQVAGLHARGIPATFINSTLSAREVEQRWNDTEFGRYRLVYVAPERLQSDLFQARAARLKVSLLAIDEAHCVSEWGHHFRPAYLQIAGVRDLLGNPPVIAVTATATPEVRRDVIEHLGLRSPEVIVKGFDRPNIVWSIFRTERKRERVLDVIGKVRGSGIVYAATRRGVEQWAEWLRRHGESAAAYHAGLPQNVRAAAQEAWIGGEERLIVATNAFGMGIDKPDVRFVIHVDVPSSLEGYYQEAGRGGRDGLRSYAVLLYHPSDEAAQRLLIEQAHPSAADIRNVYDAVCNLAQVPLGVLPETPLVVRSDAIASLTGLSTPKIRTSLELAERQQTWQILPPARHHGMIHILLSPSEARAYAESLQNRSLARFFATILRTVHADAYAGWREIDLKVLQRRTRLDRSRLLAGMEFLKEREILDWRAPGEAMQVRLSEPRTRVLPVDDLAVRRAKRRSEGRLADMLRFARSVTCRRHFLLTYFGERSPERCGSCDICLGRHQPVVITPKDEPVMRQILACVRNARVREAWFEQKPPPDQYVDGLLDWLLQENYLTVSDPLEQIFKLTPKAEDFLEQWKPRRGG